MHDDAFDISPTLHRMSGWVERAPSFWRWLGRMETRLLAGRLEDVEVRRPVWIAGLARAGSTVLLRIFADLDEVATHRYRDFPFLHIPKLWHETVRRQTDGAAEPNERAHGDRIEVTPDSPEAMEEPLWMDFFEGLHDPESSNVLEADDADPDFDAFFRNHIRKLLLARGGSRYVAKANYNVTRLAYLARAFDDARFVVPVRRPSAHVASSVKQHRLFCEQLDADDREVEHLERVGHYEFGPPRTPIHTGDDEAIAAVRRDWREGREVSGWARYWGAVYRYLAELFDGDPDVRRAVLVVRYEDLCDRSSSVLRDLLDHAGFEPGASFVDRHAGNLSRPDYYDSDLSREDRERIAERTEDVARRFGYGDEPADVPLAGS
ncbi:MAG: sulfotransferase [Bradymonadaceae bacterium]